MSRHKGDNDNNITKYIIAIFNSLNKDWYHCELCNRRLKYKGQLHHTRYKGATIKDVKIVCISCNNKECNRFII